jgi:ATP dependent DNA ligase domain
MPVVLSTSGFVAPCIPTRAPKSPAGPGWVHEIKHDGYRLQVRREGEVVRLFTRRGYDWSGRYPAIAATAAGSAPGLSHSTGRPASAVRTASRSSTRSTATHRGAGWPCGSVISLSRAGFHDGERRPRITVGGMGAGVLLA